MAASCGALPRHGMGSGRLGAPLRRRLQAHPAGADMLQEPGRSPSWIRVRVTRLPGEHRGESMRCWLAVGGSALLVLGAGCATSQNERRILLERTSAEIAYDLPAAQVMDAARAVLDGQGYLLAPGGGPL